MQIAGACFHRDERSIPPKAVLILTELSRVPNAIAIQQYDIEQLEIPQEVDSGRQRFCIPITKLRGCYMHLDSDLDINRYESS